MQFGPVVRALFEDRPNRFVVRCRIGAGRRVRAHLPNSGRLRELLLPGATLYLKDHGQRPDRRTRYTVLAVERDRKPVFLHTHATNLVARHLIERGRIPGLERAEVVRAEVTRGHSWFDFLLREGRRDLYLEVKSVTLFGNGVAMFPDAVTERGRRHLMELAEIKQRGEGETAVLFLVHHPGVRWFLPDYHTDLAFSRTLMEVRDRVRILPVAVNWSKQLRLGNKVKSLEIPWDFLGDEARDRGSYLLVLRLKRDRSVRVGKLGAFRFARGYHVYVGSAMNGLTARIERHRRRRKLFHWHIDYLRDVADEFTALPIRSSQREECEVAQALGTVLAPGPTGFGCSDCSCGAHLFTSAVDPQHLPAFHALIERFRMRAPH